MKNVFHYFKKKIYVKDGRANRQYGNTNTDKAYYPEMRFEGKDVLLDSSKVEKHDFGRGNDITPLGWLAPGFAVNKQLALEMGWFVEKYNSNPQVAIRLGPNLVMEPHGYILNRLQQNLTKMEILRPHNTNQDTGSFQEIPTVN